MLTPSRSLTLHAESGRRLPRVAAFEAIYEKLKVAPRHGEVVMIAGRSGTQKSGFGLFWVDEMNLPSLYFSADMSPFTASTRLASKRTGLNTDEVEKAMAMNGPGRQEILDSLADSRITWAFGDLSWERIDEELEAYVELWDAYPEVIVIDNLMDFAGAESDYTVQMAVMQGATELARETGSTVILMHHATDKSWDAKTDPWSPPSRQEIKGGLSEKPELSLSVALDPYTLEYRVACLKQRMGPCDPTGRTFATLRCLPDVTRFEKQ